MHAITEPISPDPDAYRQLVRRTGVVVIAFGIVELLYGFSKAPKGTINFEVVGLLAGLAIYFGGLRLHSLVRWLACLTISSGIGILVQPVLLAPMSLTLAQLRLHPLGVAAYYIPILVSLGLAAYVARRLGLPPVLDARAAAQRKVRDMRIPLALGLVLAIGGLLVLYKMLNGEDARRAAQLAADKMGPAYNYYTNHLNIVKADGQTTVIAGVQVWNDKQVLHLPVQWKR